MLRRYEGSIPQAPPLLARNATIIREMAAVLEMSNRPDKGRALYRPVRPALRGTPGTEIPLSGLPRPIPPRVCF